MLAAVFVAGKDLNIRAVIVRAAGHVHEVIPERELSVANANRRKKYGAIGVIVHSAPAPAGLIN